jgi:superfamily II DNA or RNA helicase
MAATKTRTKKSSQLTLRDRLSRLTFQQASQLLGPEGAKLIAHGGGFEFDDLQDAVYLQGDLFRLRFPDGRVVVTITGRSDKRSRLLWNCTACETTCEHVGAAFSLILEEKTLLGLAVAPEERVPLEELGEEQLIEYALQEREERAASEKMTVKAVAPGGKSPWGDYVVTSALSGKSYRVALRGEDCGDSFCSCPDFRTNTLGTCKHILHSLRKVRRRYPAKAFGMAYKRTEPSVYLKYGTELALKLGVPDNLETGVRKVIGPLKTGDVSDVSDLVRRITKLERLGQDVTIYPDAEEFIQQRLFQERIERTVAEIRSNPAKHPLRKELLKAELLPYQLDGIAFSVGAGRAILADEMGLGKTIQAIGVAELLAREAEITRVLVICPTSLKSQWRNEIHRFCDRDCQLVMGRAEERAEQYRTGAFFTICNYEQVLRDLPSIENAPWDLIVLDEGQRIKNWEAKTSNMVKSLRSKFALVLTGTPLENRLDELFSVVQFVDQRQLGPGFRFFNRHRVVDEKGKVLGYRNLDQLREQLKPVLLRRTRDTVMKDLPERTVEIVRIAPTDEQLDHHTAHMRTVSQITRKKFISEMDLLRLQKALLMCRMAADSSFLVDKQPPGYSSKLERLAELFDELFAEEDRKVVLFSEWTTMLNLIEPLLKKRNLDFVRLDGSVPQKKRQQLVQRFQTDADCRLFLTTNAGSTGLNLQAANTVINVDLPWNPAVLEQRIARAHRMGQKRSVQVYLLVTEDTLEENLLATLSSKKELAMAALDVNSDVDQVQLHSGIEELKSRLEILLGAVPEAPIDVSEQRRAEEESRIMQRREQVAAAGGQMLTSAFQFLAELLPPAPESPETSHLATELKSRLAECLDRDGDGPTKLTVTIPDASALDGLATAIARLMSIPQK